MHNSKHVPYVDPQRSDTETSPKHKTAPYQNYHQPRKLSPQPTYLAISFLSSQSQYLPYITFETSLFKILYQSKKTHQTYYYLRLTKISHKPISPKIYNQNLPLKIMKILTILAHPSKNSFNNALLNQYIEGAKQNHQVKTIYLGDLKFNPILKEGYNKIQQLEPDLLKAQKLIKWADKITLIYPIWWTTPPAILKGFFERALHPTFAFNNPEGNKFEKLLKGKSARTIATMDSPWWYYKFIVGDPAHKLIKGTLSFCGITPIKKKYICSLKFKTKEQRKKILKQIHEIGLNEK